MNEHGYPPDAGDEAGPVETQQALFLQLCMASSSDPSSHSEQLRELVAQQQPSSSRLDEAVCWAAFAGQLESVKFLVAHDAAFTEASHPKVTDSPATLCLASCPAFVRIFARGESSVDILITCSWSHNSCGSGFGDPARSGAVWRGPARSGAVRCGPARA